MRASLPTKKVMAFAGAVLLIFIIGIFLHHFFVGPVLSIGQIIASPFSYSFNTNGRLFESGAMNTSSSPYWWVNSGGFMDITGGVGQTIQGSLPSDDIWRITYQKANSLDTDNGYHPQNIFRLISKSIWQNFTESAYFKITADNLSNSPNRSESNGLLLFMHYRDSADLYYAGLRVDGTAVIKKKLNGTYYTLAQVPVFLSDNYENYDRTKNANLLPKNIWIGEKVVVQNIATNQVSIQLYTDIGKTGQWKLIAETVDDGKANGQAITDKAYVGIRTDFMDVQFSDFFVQENE